MSSIFPPWTLGQPASVAPWAKGEGWCGSPALDLANCATPDAAASGSWPRRRSSETRTAVSSLYTLSKRPSVAATMMSPADKSTVYSCSTKKTCLDYFWPQHRKLGTSLSMSADNVNNRSEQGFHVSSLHKHARHGDLLLKCIDRPKPYLQCRNRCLLSPGKSEFGFSLYNGAFWIKRDFLELTVPLANQHGGSNSVPLHFQGCRSWCLDIPAGKGSWSGVAEKVIWTQPSVCAQQWNQSHQHWLHEACCLPKLECRQ